MARTLNRLTRIQKRNSIRNFRRHNPIRNQYVDIEAREVGRNSTRVRPQEDTNMLINTLRTALQNVKNKRPDIQLGNQWRNYNHFEKHIIKLAKQYITRGLTVKEQTQRLKRQAPLLQRIELKRRNRQGLKHKYIFNKDAVLALAMQQNHPNFEEYLRTKNTRENNALAADCIELHKLGVQKGLTYCPYETRLSRQHDLIPRREQILTPNFNCKLYAIKNKRGNVLFRMSSECSICHHKKNLSVSKKLFA